VTLLDRYIFRSVLLTCAGAVGLFAFLILLVNLMRDLLSYVLAGQISWFTVAHLTPILLPVVLPYALPLGVLTGVLLTLGRLSADSEITAMRTAGLSLPRIARPIFIFAVLGVATALYVNYEAMPHGRVEYEQELANALHTNALGLIVPHTFVHNFPNTVVYAGDKHGDQLGDIWVWKLDDDQRMSLFVHAQSGHINYDEEKNSIEARLLQAQIEWRNAAQAGDFSKPAPESVADVFPLTFPLDKVFSRGQGIHRKLQWMTLHELLAERSRLATQPVAPAEARDHARAIMKVQLTVSDKANTALAVLSFALIGVPLGMMVSRRETGANLGVSVLLALGWYFLTFTISLLDRHPEYRPDLLLWLPNLIFIALGLRLFYRLDRR
jgi:lipopolysaccharide export system permease protein